MQKTYFLSSLHHGAYYGLAAFAFYVLMFYTLGNPLGPISWLGAWIPVVYICKATKDHRDVDLGGYITYWEAFRTGFFTIAFGGALFAIMLYLFASVVAVNLLDDYKKMTIDQTEIFKMYPYFEKYIDKIIKSINDLTLSDAISGDYYNKVLGAAITAFITAAIYSKPKPVANDVH